VRALLDGRTAEVYAQAAARFRGRVPFETFDRTWTSRVAATAGPAGDISVACHRQEGLIAADVTVAFAQGPLLMRIGFQGSGEVAGLRFLPSPEEP
jgi:hypothetical protein